MMPHGALACPTDFGTGLTSREALQLQSTPQSYSLVEVLQFSTFFYIARFRWSEVAELDVAAFETLEARCGQLLRAQRV